MVDAVAILGHAVGITQIFAVDVLHLIFDVYGRVAQRLEILLSERSVVVPFYEDKVIGCPLGNDLGVDFLSVFGELLHFGHIFLVLFLPFHIVRLFIFTETSGENHCYQRKKI